MRGKLLTKEMLENYGITEITRDGKVFKDDKELKQSLYRRKGKYKLQQPYAQLVVSDKTQKIYCINKKGYKYWTYKAITIPVSRAVYAWYHGEIPAGYEIDHIDTNTLNNDLSNLRLLTKEENLTRKKVSRNQYNYWKTDEEILAERENKKYVYDRATHKAVKSEWWTEKKNEKKIEKAVEKAKQDAVKELWHDLISKLKAKQKERIEVKGIDIEKWRKLGDEINALKIAIMETRKKLNK